MLNDLATELANLYDVESSRRVVSDAGIDEALIDFSGKALDVWYRIVRLADRQNKLAVLLSKVLNEYGNNTKLQRIYGTFLYGQLPKADGFAMSMPRDNRIDTDALGRLEQTVSRLTETVKGGEWGGEGLLATVKRVETEVKHVSVQMQVLSLEIATLKKVSAQNQWMWIIVGFVVFVLAVAVILALNGAWKPVT